MGKRRHERFIKRLEVKFSSGGKTYTGLSSDLSETFQKVESS
ncbi:MAG: PilZ domain-containing protein [Nitrospira sp.]|nr:PilZ domain-containing protein [Nitrospira sp.]